MRVLTECQDDGYASAQHIARSHECPDCHHRSRLAVRFNTTIRQHEVICHRCKRTTNFVRRESLTAQWRRNPDSVPVEIAAKLERKYGTPMTEQSLVNATESAMVKRIESARWLAELKPQDRQSLAHLAVKYGLDPLMKEMTLYEGTPYISVAGLIRIAHRQKMFAGLEDRPMTSEERQQYGYKAPFCWLVKVYRKDWHCPATGSGTADPANPFRNNPIERTRPEWMARSRAIRQALKLAFPHSLPFEDMGSTEDAGIDPETGEIIDGEAVEVNDSDADFIGDLAEANGTAIPEPQDEEAHKRDLREQIEKIITERKLKREGIEQWAVKHCGCSYADLSHDGLLALHEALTARVG